MASQGKKVKRPDKSLARSKGPVERELCSLKTLLSLVSVPVSRPQVAAGSQPRSQHVHHRNNKSSNKSSKHTAKEASELESFRYVAQEYRTPIPFLFAGSAAVFSTNPLITHISCTSVTYRNERDFSHHPLHKLFLNIFTCLIKNRLVPSEWLRQASPDNILGVLICLRLLIRDPHHQKVFHELHGVDALARYMESVSSDYLEGGYQIFAVDKLVNMTYIFQKLSAVEHQRAWVVKCRAHEILVKLLTSRDSSALLGALLALTSLADSLEYKEKIGELPIVGSLLVILQEYDLLSKRVSAELLRLLCPATRIREQVRAYEGVPVLLSLLQSDHLRLLGSAVWVLVQLCEDPGAAAEIRAWGGVQQLLHILCNKREYISDRCSVETLSSANAAGRIQRQCVSEEFNPKETLENVMSLQTACCAALTELILDDTTAHQVVQENGVYIIGKLILPQSSQPGPKATSLQCYAFRTLRFLFSVERNRRLFKRLFSAELFEMFIDVGHYVRDITSYEPLQARFSLLSEEELKILRESIEAVNLHRSPLKVINGYAVLDHLGSGAFGSVYKVRKQNGQNLLALKEVNLHNPAFGKDKKDQDVSVEKVVCELSIIKEQISHPNIVKYYKTFLESDRLYIVMELIDGVPLAEHLNSLKEKQQRFTEDRIWNIFIQMCLALRYLHTEKKIVHRDLSPNNIMLGERDRVTITDFGLAKQKEASSKLTSLVGTILYSCPEIVKSEPYGEKADVWALGCILYQMAVLRPAFYSSNVLTLATKIVEAVYEPVEDGVFSTRVTDIIKWCLTPDADLRPNIVEVSARISDLMMKFIDNLCTSQQALERKLERDRKRALKYFLEASRGGLGASHSYASQGMGAEPSRCTDGLADVRSDPCDTESSPPPTQCPAQEEEGSGLVERPLWESPQGSKQGCIKRIVSSSAYEERNCAGGDLAVTKTTPQPASAGICVPQKKVRQIDDPVQLLLLLLHKIIYISQLPPTLQHDFKRWVVERFKKTLFDSRSSPYNLKMELKKLLQGSPEIIEQIDFNWSSSIQSFGGKRFSIDNKGDSDYVSLQDGVTYEQMMTIIEEVLEEHEYCSTLSKRSDHHP
ncbi:serine/threonine-protein kinase Nek10 isoform X2 [Brienomyrus brachyistius]|uniref:serine/threonine-protein kinase Nek10 isoform X2 n=1 Tax=Brienomyrus brachyistius TaxID=42636 RepID=UPI0020B1C879|nr:serine/threonine-protein kinase Nek10 isoform X2 [Brienomyrus brachyistius]